MAAANAFLTQLSERTWMCSECALIFLSDQTHGVDEMLDRFASHARQQHTGRCARPARGERRGNDHEDWALNK